ncbi:MAG: hypothetical protein GXP49_12645 [Deltaproteobacteria bacterium]|nr:hypothetical protein [Deltaproteobacteria bacterium]
MLLLRERPSRITGAGFYFVALLSAFVLFLASIAQAKDAEDTPGFAYPGAMERPLADDMRLNGLPVLETYFFTSDEIDHVADYYFEAMTRSGLMVAESGSKGRRTLIGVRPNGSMVFSVNMYDYGGKVAVFPSRMPMHLLARKQDARNKSSGSTLVPIFPGADGVSNLETNDRQMVTQTIGYQDRRSLTDNIRFYLSQMRAKGWKVVPRASRVQGNVAVMSFERTRMSCTITVTRDEKKRLTLVTAVLNKRLAGE